MISSLVFSSLFSLHLSLKTAVLRKNLTPDKLQCAYTHTHVRRVNYNLSMCYLSINITQRCVRKSENNVLDKDKSNQDIDPVGVKYIPQTMKKITNTNKSIYMHGMETFSPTNASKSFISINFPDARITCIEECLVQQQPLFIQSIPRR